jgi:hypothetical protein
MSQCHGWEWVTWPLVRILEVPHQGAKSGFHLCMQIHILTCLPFIYLQAYLLMPNILFECMSTHVYAKFQIGPHTSFCRGEREGTGCRIWTKGLACEGSDLGGRQDEGLVPEASHLFSSRLPFALVRLGLELLSSFLLE